VTISMSKGGGKESSGTGCEQLLAGIQPRNSQSGKKRRCRKVKTHRNDLDEVQTRPRKCTELRRERGPSGGAGWG